MELERVDEQPLLPREQLDTQYLGGELDDREPERRFVGQIPQRRRP